MMTQVLRCCCRLILSIQNNLLGELMSAIHHDLLHELPEFREKIHQLKLEDNHFSKLFDEYHKINSDVLRLEAENIPVTDETFESLKKQRLHLKDKLYNILAA
jgi:uncharacterized protein YdcH (DUF465 family)